MRTLDSLVDVEASLVAGLHAVAEVLVEGLLAAASTLVVVAALPAAAGAVLPLLRKLDLKLGNEASPCPFYSHVHLPVQEPAAASLETTDGPSYVLYSILPALV